MSSGLSRVVVALVAIPVFVGCTVLGGVYFFILVETLVAIGTWEALNLIARKGARPQWVMAIAGSVGIGCLYHLNAMQLLLPSLLVLTLAVLLVELFRNDGSALVNTSGTIFPVLYAGLLMGCLIAVRQQPMGDQIVFLILGGLWGCDTLAYYGGTLLGRHRLFERVSPKKTWEGAVAGLFGAIAGVAIVRWIYTTYLGAPALEWLPTFLIGLTAGTIGQIGDLAESLLKRDAEVKDSSRLIPGHGGVLDRFDSLMFVTPVVYIYLSFFVD